MLGICCVHVFLFVVVCSSSSRAETAGCGGGKRARERESLSGWHLGGPSCCRHCLSPTRGPGTSGQAWRLPGSLLGYGSGPQTRSHAGPSVPPLHSAKPCPAQHNTALPDETQSRAGGTTVSPEPDALLFWWNPSSAEVKNNIKFSLKPQAAHLKCI